MRKFIILVGIIVIGIAAYVAAQKNRHMPMTMVKTPDQSNALASVKLPATLSVEASIGKTAYQAKCSTCHGDNAAGKDGVAPPLVHYIYEPSHHGDEAFQRAASLGVRSHHWPFGDMPKIEGLTRADVATIIAYIRELQRFNGIN
ncbi:Cytochrome c [Roseovarius litorisediminis]|uniref:Cytochrome c n=1 Tax=Roseovarius litorisediminis TaxID=1312363 RepID=A0A1Y5R952_9RHOB|nr:cytochrome c [Roseovarius litorisediminis]SLN11288.1 Cytochrome c [Roseovarius litorisediminis]